MRWVHLSVVVLFAIVMLIFAVQNREMVTINFLDFSLRTPHAVMAVIFYLLGTVTGGSLIALLRRSASASWVGGAENSRPYA